MNLFNPKTSLNAFRSNGVVDTRFLVRRQCTLLKKMSESAAKTQQTDKRFTWIGREMFTLCVIDTSVVDEPLRVNANQIQGQEVKTIRSNSTERTQAFYYMVLCAWICLPVSLRTAYCILYSWCIEVNVEGSRKNYDMQLYVKIVYICNFSE